LKKSYFEKNIYKILDIQETKSPEFIIKVQSGIKNNRTIKEFKMNSKLKQIIKIFFYKTLKVLQSIYF